MVVEQGNYHVNLQSITWFPDRGYSDILYGISSIDVMGCCTQNTHGTQSHGNYLVLLP